MRYKLDKRILNIKVNVKATLRDAKTGQVKRTEFYYNTIASVGLNLIAEFLGNETPTTSAGLSPNFCGVGTGTTTPTVNDTQLQTETKRNLVSSKSSSGNVAYITGFFGSSDVSGTLTEVGLFINGTSTANSGILLDRTLINITKSTQETLTIDFIITIS